MNENQIGFARVRKLIQKHGNIGGAKSVFVKLEGIRNELVYPTFGGIIKNYPKGPSKYWAGDLCEYRTNENGIKPEVYLLKTYKVAKTTSTSADVTFYRTPYSHIPFIGDKISKAPAKIGGASTAYTVNAVKEGVDEHNTPIWTVTLSATATFTKDEVLVESDGTNMMVKNINGVIDSDMDLLDAGTSDFSNDFENARYLYTPALGGLMYTHKMQALPKCVLDLNESKVNGWFKIQF